MLRLLLLQALIGMSWAATDFTWGFNQGGNSLPQCGSVQLGIYAGNGTQDREITPPTFAITFPLNSDLSPSIQSLGVSTTGYYRVNYPAGTQLVIGIVDAFSLFGGWAPTLTVASSSDSSCLNSISSPSLTVSLNTTSVSQCGVVGVQVSGGQAPYTFTVFPASGVTETYNVTSGVNDNYLSWVNNFGPSNQVAIGVRDQRGDWAPVAGPITLVGEAQTCSPALVSGTSNGPPPQNAGQSSSSSSSSRARSSSSSGASASSAAPTSNQGNDPVGTTSGSKSNAGAIAGGVVGGVLALLLLLGALFFWRRRKRQQAAKSTDKRYSYHNVAYTGQPSPPLNGPIPADAQVTPFSLSSTGASQGHSASPSLPGSGSQSGSRPEMAMATAAQPAVVNGFRVANPSDLEETLAPPVAGFAGHARQGSDPSRALPQPPSKQGEASASRASLDSEGGRRVVQAQDAGPVAAEETEEIPPAYTGIRR